MLQLLRDEVPRPYTGSLPLEPGRGRPSPDSLCPPYLQILAMPLAVGSMSKWSSFLHIWHTISSLQYSGQVHIPRSRSQVWVTGWNDAKVVGATSAAAQIRSRKERLFRKLDVGLESSRISLCHGRPTQQLLSSYTFLATVNVIINIWMINARDHFIDYDDRYTDGSICHSEGRS